MNKYKFSDLYYLGVNVNPDQSNVTQRSQIPEAIICGLMSLAVNDGRVASLIISFFHRYDFLISNISMVKFIKKMDNQNEINFLVGILKKVNEVKYKQAIRQAKKIPAKYYSKICKIKIENNVVNPDPEFASVGILTQGFEYEDDSKYFVLDRLKEINPNFCHHDTKNHSLIQLKNIGFNKFKFQANANSQEELIYLYYLGLSDTITDARGGILPEECIAGILKNNFTAKIKYKITTWLSMYSDLINLEYLNKCMKKLNCSYEKNKFISACLRRKSNKRGDGLKALASRNIFIKNRILMGLTNRADIASMMFIEPHINPYQISMKLLINYETAHRNFNNLALLTELV